MLIPDTITSVTLFAEEDFQIYFKQFYYKSSKLHWRSLTNKVTKGANILCLCNWLSCKSSLTIVSNKCVDVSLIKLPSEKNNPFNLNISVSKFGQIKSLKTMCLEIISAYNLPTDIIEKLSYFKAQNLIKQNLINLRLMSINVNNYEFNSCKRIHGRCRILKQNQF
jgi:hypothetical protein